MASPPFKNTEHELRDQQETFEACAQVSLFYPSATSQFIPLWVTSQGEQPRCQKMNTLATLTFTML